MPTPPPCVVVLCDFDGTITLNDLTNVVWDRFLPYDWRARLLPASEQGAITATELMRRGYVDVQQPQRVIEELLQQAAKIRPGYARLLALCTERQWDFLILSNGLRFYIEATVGKAVPVWAHEAHFDDTWHVELPANVAVGVGEDFKACVVRQLRQTHPQASFVYIGDGRLDFEPARLCDHIFAVRGSVLDLMCERERIACDRFVDFDEMSSALSRRFTNGDAWAHGA